MFLLAFLGVSTWLPELWEEEEYSRETRCNTQNWRLKTEEAEGKTIIKIAFLQIRNLHVPIYVYNFSGPESQNLLIKGSTLAKLFLWPILVNPKYNLANITEGTDIFNMSTKHKRNLLSTYVTSQIITHALLFVIMS